ncbi:hypothetical protein [Streptomyces sviceus]|uniref:hypothetical protein n=1 Tax=Streptomyces sviceus TaxID=285530 RepID=UPI0036E0FF49
MIATLLGVAGTLLGAIVTGTFQHLAAGRAERAAGAEQLRGERLDAVTTLGAGSNHRRALWMRGEARPRGADEAEREELRARSHTTRSAITRPLVALRLLVPDPAVHATAQPMVVATYDMVDAATTTRTLTAAQDAARAAHDRVIEAAAAYFGTHG